MSMLWSGGRTDKISNKLAGDVVSLWLNGRASAAFAGVPGSIPGWGVCDFFPFLPKLHFQFPFPLSLPLSFPSSSLSFPFLFLSLRPFVCTLKYVGFYLLLSVGLDVWEGIFISFRQRCFLHTNNLSLLRERKMRLQQNGWVVPVWMSIGTCRWSVWKR